jgi:hypothetical protein
MFACWRAEVYRVVTERYGAEMDKAGGYHFAAVKAALVTAFGIAPDREARFFARLEHLRRVGVMGDERPGKGSKLSYSADQVDRLLFVAQLSRFSIEPVVAFELIETKWPPPRRRDAEVAVTRGEHSICELFEVARKWGTNPLTHICMRVEIGDDFISTANLPEIGYFTGKRESLDGLYGWLGKDQNSGSVFDLSAKLKLLDDALAETAKAETKTQISETAQRIVDVGKVRRGEMTLKEYRGKHRSKRGK